MKKVKERLEKAKYELQQARKYEDQGGNQFRYNLENFISNARSVFNLLVNELEESEKELESSGKNTKAQTLTTWRKNQKNQLWKDPLFKYFKDRRDYILKKGRSTLKLNVTLHDTVNLPEKIVITKKDERENLICITSAESKNDEEPRKERDPERTWQFEDNKGKSAINLCESLIELIEQGIRPINKFSRYKLH
jgi:hypothetical protein